MITIKEKLIEKINKIKNENLLNEAYRLISVATDNIDIYELSDFQNEAIAEARYQIENKHSLTEKQANKEIEEWLNK